MRGSALLHWIRFIIGIDQPHSQTTKAEQLIISKYASKSAICVEIGVYEGLNTVNIAKNLPPLGKLYAIDPFFKGRLGISYGKMIAYAYAKKNKVLDKVFFIEKLSYDAIDDIPNDIDFSFIDGDHSIMGIERDWHDWSKKTKVGGIIALHDTSIPIHDPSVIHLGSYKYFNEFIVNDKRFKVIETVDSLNILRKIL